MWEIKLYQKENGKVPVEIFMEDATAKTQAKILREIEMLEEFGISLRMPHTRPLGNELYELRVKCENKVSRIIYFHFTNNTFVLLTGFVKKTETTPQSEIDTARSYMKDYRRRNR